MYIAMNRFRISKGREQEFVEIWRNRESYLDTVAGFQSFNLLQGASTDEATIFISHSVWESSASFERWTRSEAFKKAHSGARPPEGLHLGPPQFEGYEKVL